MGMFCPTKRMPAFFTDAGEMLSMCYRKQTALFGLQLSKMSSSQRAFAAPGSKKKPPDFGWLLMRH